MLKKGFMNWRMRSQDEGLSWKGKGKKEESWVFLVLGTKPPNNSPAGLREQRTLQIMTQLFKTPLGSACISLPHL